MIDINLKGKKAVVTGASLGIGEAVVKMLADHGADVDFCARNHEAVEILSSYESKGKINGHIADMGNSEDTNHFIEKVLTGGNVDILVNNVGASPSRNFLYM